MQTLQGTLYSEGYCLCFAGPQRNGTSEIMEEQSSDPTFEAAEAAPSTEQSAIDDTGSDSISPQSDSFPIVGLGASAGGIHALQTFFDGMNPESGLAFVVVMHLSPDFQSGLATVLQARTKMPVIQVIEPTSVEPNHVYVIPPN